MGVENAETEDMNGSEGPIEDDRLFDALGGSKDDEEGLSPSSCEGGGISNS